MAEVMIGMAGSVIIVGALLFGSIGLQKSLHATELYSSYHADQRRVLDYMARDLRRAIGIASTTTVNGSASTKLASGSISVDEHTGLLLTLPGYYQNNTPKEQSYDQALPVVNGTDRVDYGDKSGPAPGVLVIFRKEFLVSENCVCVIRQEADTAFVIVRHAENMQLQVAIGPDGSSCDVEISFKSPYGNTAPLVTTHDSILLRNIRSD